MKPYKNLLVPAFVAVPAVNRKPFDLVKSFTVTPTTVTVCYDDENGNEKTEELSTKDTQLSILVES